jgi:predicted dehydrogenase
MTKLGMVGTGFVADHYMRSLTLFPELNLVGAYDTSAERLEQFSTHWKVPSLNALDALIAAVGPGGIMLNLTNPSAHYDISRRCLEAGLHIYSEKPMAVRLEDAQALHALAASKGLMIASAPCTFLGEAAQTVGAAIRRGVLGRPRLIYAELDDDFISKAPYQSWISTTGKPWPAEDEFTVGCTLEHAGYYLTWLIAIFGSIRTVVAASACLAPDQMGVDKPAPDFSVATLFFESGLVARLTCSILAPHDRSLRIIGDHGVLELEDCWDNDSPVRFRRRFNVRRRLINAPVARRLRLAQPTHPKTARWGAVSLNYALGPKEMADALAEGRPCRASADLALHLTEVTLAIQASGEGAGAQTMQTRCAPVAPMPWASQLRGY